MPALLLAVTVAVLPVTVESLSVRSPGLPLSCSTMIPPPPLSPLDRGTVDELSLTVESLSVRLWIEKIPPPPSLKPEPGGASWLSVTVTLSSTTPPPFPAAKPPPPVRAVGVAGVPVIVRSLSTAGVLLALISIARSPSPWSTVAPWPAPSIVAPTPNKSCPWLST